MPIALGEFEQLVLFALVRLGPSAYGATVRREIEERTGRAVSISAVYTTLERLEQKGLVRSRVGAVAALKDVAVVQALPKTRSGKILRRTMREIADGAEGQIPATIDDPSVLDTLRPVLRRD